MIRSIRLPVLALAAVATSSSHAAIAAERDWPERLVGHGGPVKAVMLSDDGARALTASFDYSVILWDMSGKEGRILARLEGHRGGGQ